ncbi:recombinase family protein [Halomarina oriensis]|uniref:Resolvase n=1 Tax=Halomarina oriensis TaxID=671145 RepID=A0A6B0GH68_9EURY|nr:recombinase family protein [Halomarina oriensis]MWG33111.1 resolvase [Halomarina oriensis]
MERVTAYVRRSKFEQENEHQFEAIREWFEREGVDFADVDVLSETGSGADRSREQLRELMARIEADEVDHVVVWELSRIAREGQLAQTFFNLCEDHDVHVHVTSGSIREIKPDGTNRFVADILAAVYAEERRTLIRRTRYGQQRALRAGKWVGGVPLGFTTDEDGYLIANVDFYDEFDEERDGFWTVAEAMRILDENPRASYRGLASEMVCTRRSLSNLDNNEERRRWYLDLEADDERVANALDEVTATA